jgi:hypothetical protein
MVLTMLILALSHEIMLTLVLSNEIVLFFHKKYRKITKVVNGNDKGS